jgi:aspartate aminotransferase
MSQSESSILARHLNPNVSSLRPSATLAINEKSAKLAREGRKIYKLGFGQSPFPPPDLVVDALKENAAQKDYLPVKGLSALREAVADFHQRRHDIAATNEDILIGPGSKELMFQLQLAYQGELIIPSPSWVSYQPQAHLLGLKAYFLPTRKEERWCLQPDELEKFCSEQPSRPRLLILNYPNNPTGATFNENELEGLARVAQKYGLLVLSDEIYGELNHTAAHVSIAKFYAEGTIVSSGLSKWCSVGGWRLGTFCFPSSLRWLQDAMACIASETYSSVSAPIQYAAVVAFQDHSEIDDYLFQVRRILCALGNAVTERLNEIGIETNSPEGGFYLFPDFVQQADSLRSRGIKTGTELCEWLLVETGVALLPGEDFGRPSTELTCRLAYVDFDGRECLSAAQSTKDDAELDADFLREHCGNVMTAIDLIGSWL